MFAQNNSEIFNSTLSYYKVMIHFENTSLDVAKLLDISDSGMKIDMYSLTNIPINCNLNATLYNLSDKSNPKSFKIQGKVVQIQPIPRTHKTMVEVIFNKPVELPDDIIALKISSSEIAA